MRLSPVFIRDELNDEQSDALKCLAQSRPDAFYVCSIKTAIKSPIAFQNANLSVHTVCQVDLQCACALINEIMGSELYKPNIGIPTVMLTEKSIL